MNMITRSRARVLLRLSIRIAPRQRVRWFEAMASELDHVPDASLRRFAIGCLTAAVHARVVSPHFMLASAHILLVIGALAWAALNAWFAGRMSNINAEGPAGFTYATAATFALGGLLTARFGFKATLALGAPLLLALGTAALAIRVLAYDPLYFALIVEDITILLLGLGIASSIPRLVAHKQANGL